MNKKILATAVLSVIANGAFAESIQPESMETMVVTANRYEQGVKDLVSPIEVITRDEIKAIQPSSITDLLKRLPGVQVANQGGPGNTSALFIRGRSTRNVLVMINGIRVGSATTGMASLSALPLKSIERVELLRGPRSSTYGTDAVSGVLNIITSSKNDVRSEVGVGFGSNGHTEYNATYANTFGDSWLNFTGSYVSSDGYNVIPTSINAADKDDDGYKSKYVIIDGGTDFNDQFSLKGTSFFQAEESDYDSPWPGNDEAESENYNVGVTGEYKGNDFISSLTLATNQDKLTTSGQVPDTSDIKTNRYSATLHNKFDVNSSMVISGGLDWYEEKVDNSRTELSEDTRSNVAAYLGTTYYGNGYTTELNARIDDNETFGDFKTFQVGANYDLNEHLRLVGLFGTAFKAPTFNNLYWPRFCSAWGCYEGNPNLLPEESTSGEIAVESSFDILDVRVGYHHSEVENLISTVGDSPQNIGEAEIKGVEVVASFDTFGIYHDVSYDWLDTENKATGKELVRRAEHSAKWNMGYEFCDFQFDVSTIYQGKRFSDTANDVELEAYSLTDVAVTYHFNSNLDLRARVANVFDKEYETVKDFVTPERAYYANVSYTF